MDKKIAKIQKDVSKISKAHQGKHDEKKMQKNIGKVSKELVSLKKMDIKRDPACDLGEKIKAKKMKVMPKSKK